MSTSTPNRSASLWASVTTSSMVMLATGTRGHTSIAPNRGCAPVWVRMSMSSLALAAARTAASITGSGAPTNVTTVRLVATPGSTSRSVTPSTAFIASVIRLITAMSRPSEKFGTHSMSWLTAAVPPQLSGSSMTTAWRHSHIGPHRRPIHSRLAIDATVKPVRCFWRPAIAFLRRLRRYGVRSRFYRWPVAGSTRGG